MTEERNESRDFSEIREIFRQFLSGNAILIGGGIVLAIFLLWFLD